MFPDSIKKFIDIFASLPSIGTRQAARLCFHLINSGKAKIEEVSEVIKTLKSLKICSECFLVHDTDSRSGNLCHICRDPKRHKGIIMIVEKETDLISLEKTKKFKGRYLILGPLSKSGAMEPIQKLRLNQLKNSIKKQSNSLSTSSGQAQPSLEATAGKAEEIIIAINPTTYGDLNASLITKELAPFAKKISRLGRGLPTGGEIEFADEETLSSALESRG